MDYKLHYASLELQGDIPCYNLQGFHEIAAFLLAESSTESVFLVSILDEVFVTDNIAVAIRFIELFNFKDGDTSIASMLGARSEILEIAFQEYDSFEDAYEISLDLQDVKEHCYKKQK